MYKSPIELIYESIQSQQSKLDEFIYKEIQKVDIKVDKEELLKALAYDREQYRKGYEDAKAEQKSGHWNNVNNFETMYIGECSECKDEVFIYKGNEKRWKYCPNCGAKMEERK